MAEFIHEHSTRVKDEDGTAYVVRIYARQRTDGTWEGWLEFHPTDKRKSVLRTEQETSQPNRLAVEYWASGLEPIYLDKSRTGEREDQHGRRQEWTHYWPHLRLGAICEHQRQGAVSERLQSGLEIHHQLHQSGSRR